MRKYLYVLLAGMVLTACTSTKVETYKKLEANKHFTDGIDFFQGTFEEAKILAKKHKSGFLRKQPERLIFVDAYAVWCGPCKWMSANVFPKPEAGDYFNEHFVSMKIDCEKGEGIKLAREWHVSAYPTLLILDPNGNVIARQIGAIDHKRLVEWGKEIRQVYLDGKKEKN